MVAGSMILDVDDLRLDVVFLSNGGVVLDSFQITKSCIYVGCSPPALPSFSPGSLLVLAGLMGVTGFWYGVGRVHRVS